MTKVIPSATNPTMLFCLTILIRFSDVRNAAYLANPKIDAIRSAINAP